MKTNISRKNPFAWLPPDRQAGFTLVELMVSITLGLFMMAALTSLLLSQTAARDEFDKASRQIENGRYAMQILHDDIELAGYYGQLFSIPSATYPLPATLPDPCATDLASLTSAVPLSIQGYDALASGVVATRPTCLSAANYLRGDILVIRRADTSLTTIAAANAGPAAEVYIQATGSQFVLNTGSNANTTNFNLTSTTSTSTNPADLRADLVRIYFISPCSNMANGTTCASSDDTIPTLKRLELNTAGTLTLTPLVEGIENMQLDYGIDSDGDGYPDSYITTPATVTDWSNVVAIRINLLARNNDPSAGYSDSKTYTMTAADVVVTGASAPVMVGPYNDNYKRHAYSEVVRAINLTGRRAQE